MSKVIISTESSWMAKEALQAGEVLRAQLENSANMNEWVAQLRAAPPNAFITVARGSSDGLLRDGAGSRAVERRRTSGRSRS